MEEQETIEIKTVSCPRCGVQGRFVVPCENYERYKNGWSVQDAFPMLSADEREQILTGWCGSCWDDEFLVEEDELDGNLAPFLTNGLIESVQRALLVDLRKNTDEDN